MTRLEQLRLDALLSRQALARGAGVAYQTVINLEEGKGGRPHIDTLRKLAEFLDAKPSELMRPALPLDQETAA